MTGAGGYVSHADLGGSTGHGSIDRDADGLVLGEMFGEVFHHEWEGKALALTLAAGAPGGWNIDMSRSARETLPNYGDLTYYEIWTAALERLIIEHGLADERELAAGRALAPGDPTRRVLRADQVSAALARGGPTARESSGPARFALGDSVRTRDGHVDHHTRLPSYVAGRLGTIKSVHGAHVFPDTNSRGLGEQPQWLYTVVFDATELWDDAAPGHRVSVDAWESYLSPADTSLVGTSPIEAAA